MDKELLGRMAVIAQKRCVDVKEVFSYPNGPAPWSLAGPLGEMRKTDKSVVVKDITKEVPLSDTVALDNGAVIIDGMALVQSTKPTDTYGGVARQLFKRSLALSGKASQIHMVFDVYEELSIKNTERNRRSKEKILLKNITAGHKVKQWRKVLGSAANKTELIRFLYMEWRKPEFVSLLGERCFFVTFLDECTCISRNSISVVNELRCVHEHGCHYFVKQISSFFDQNNMIIQLFCRKKEIPFQLQCKIGI